MPSKRRGLTAISTVTTRLAAAARKSSLSTKEYRAFVEYLATCPFRALPVELHLQIIESLSPIDRVCLSLVEYYLLPLSYS